MFNGWLDLSWQLRREPAFGTGQGPGEYQLSQRIELGAGLLGREVGIAKSLPRFRVTKWLLRKA